MTADAVARVPEDPPRFCKVRGLPLVGSLLPISRNPLRFFTDVLSRSDGAQLGLLGGRCVLLLAHPRDLETILVRDRDAYGRSAEILKLRPLFGRGLLASDGELWRNQRAAIAPSFGRDALGAYASLMLATIERQLDGWQDGETHDVHAEMMRYTRETICTVLFGESFNGPAPELGAAVTTVFGELRSEVLYLPIWRRLPLRRSRKWNRAVALLERTIAATIHARRAGADAGGGDLLDALLQARDPLGRGMPDRQIYDEIMTFFLAGHETAAVTLTWACYLLARHPELQERVRAEVGAIAAHRLASADYAQLRFTTAVVKEALRLYPPVWSIGRKTNAATSLDGRPVPEGTDVWLCIYRTQRDARWFAQPDRFVPDRWLDDPPPKPYTYLPFGFGPRVCIGQHFAMIETVLALAALCSRFRLLETQSQPVEPSAWITLRPARRVLLKAMRVEAWTARA